MSLETFALRSRIAAPAEDVFRWHSRPGALERLTPPWTQLTVVERSGGIENGARAVLRMGLGPIHMRWVAEHYDNIDGRQFRDRQIAGPFAHWVHTHHLEPDGPDGCFLEDTIEYALPLGLAGSLVGGSFVRGMLDRMFAYRHRTTAADIATHAKYKGAPLHVLMSGSSGLVGSALVPFLSTGGHRVTRLVRSTPRADESAIAWHPDTGTLDANRLEGIDAVVHLAGENIAGGRWTEATKRRIKDSRIQGTRLLCETLARLQAPPSVLISASAIGYYGNRDGQVLDEDSPSGDGFLAQVCRDWEAATAPAAERGIRVVNLRIGVVLTPAGGALAKLLPPFQLGVGGRVGSGAQYMSWIAIDDLVGAILHAMRIDALDGPVNAVAPEALSNMEFSKTLGTVLKRPTIVPVPATALRLALGQMADEMLLASSLVIPRRLTDSGFVFHYASVEPALRHLLGK